MLRKCNYCPDMYEAEARYINRGHGIYCSRLCAGRANGEKRKAQSELNATCAYCQQKFHKAATRMKTKTGLVFCCRKHKDLAQRIENGLTELQPSHYGTGHSKYRKKAFSYYAHRCDVCGYDKYKDVLVVHHKDRDRSNSDIENLVVLCPTHHDEHHYETQTGKWTQMAVPDAPTRVKLSQG